MLENRVSRKIGLFAIVCAVVFAFAAGSRGEQITGGEGIARRTLPRQFDVIKVQGDLLGRFDGVPIKNLSLLAFKGGSQLGDRRRLIARRLEVAVDSVPCHSLGTSAKPSPGHSSHSPQWLPRLSYAPA